MNMMESTTWLFLMLLIYGIAMLYWARTASHYNATAKEFFSAGGSLAPWVTAIGLSGASISGWIILGLPQIIANQGFGASVLTLSGIVIPLTGVLFLKPQWAIARRHNFTSQGDMLNAYYGGNSIGVISAATATLLAIGFAGIQLRSISQLLAELSGNPEFFPLFVWGTALTVLAYLVIGGMRAVGYLSVLQTVLIALSITGLGLFVLISNNGLTAVSEGLATLGQTPESSARGLFEVAGVVQFTAGLGIETPIASQWTAVMILSTAFALMGIQSSPMATQMILSTSNPKGIAAGQTWVLAGFFGALLVSAIVLIGAVGIGKEANRLPALMSSMSIASPWFMAILTLGFLAAVHLVMGLSVLTAANALIRDVYTPFFHQGISQKDQLLFSRVAISLLVVFTALLALLAPFALSALSSVALPVAFQMWPALLGLCWFKFITRQAVIAGAIVGIIAVFLTDTAGIKILDFLGLQLPWGRWPWTVHSAGWGIFFNLLALLVISAITQGRGHSIDADDIRAFLSSYMKPKYRSRGLKPAAWSVALSWLFLAVGPGVVLGNRAFGSFSGGIEAWTVGLPSIWAWTIMFWVLGVFLIWFLSYKMELASESSIDITPLEPLYKAVNHDTTIQKDEMLRLAWIISVTAIIVTVSNWTFG